MRGGPGPAGRVRLLDIGPAAEVAANGREWVAEAGGLASPTAPPLSGPEPEKIGLVESQRVVDE